MRSATSSPTPPPAAHAADGFVSALESASLKASDPDLQRDLAGGEQETERLAKLLADLLRLAQDGQRPAAARVGLGATAARAAERWREQAERGAHAIDIADRDEVEIAATNGDLDTILDNLLEIALNYTPAGEPVALDWGRDHDGAFVAVLDRGPGLGEGEADHVFDRFYRGRSSQGGSVPGTGLGLGDRRDAGAAGGAVRRRSSTGPTAVHVPRFGSRSRRPGPSSERRRCRWL